MLSPFRPRFFVLCRRIFDLIFGLILVTVLFSVGLILVTVLFSAGLDGDLVGAGKLNRGLLGIVSNYPNFTLVLLFVISSLALESRLLLTFS